MTVRTITFDDELWQVVPRQMTTEMLRAVFVLADDWSALLAAAPEPPAQQPIINVVFRCEANGIVGTTSHQSIHSVSQEDDGSFTAELDYWPAPTQQPAQQPMTDAEIACLIRERDNLRELVSAITDNRGKCFIPTLGIDTPDALLNWDERARAALDDGEES